VPVRPRSSDAREPHFTVPVTSVTRGFGRNRHCGELSTGSFVGLRLNDAERRRKHGVETPADEHHSWCSSTDQNLRVGDGMLVQRLRESRDRVHGGVSHHPTGRSSASLRGRAKANWQHSRPRPKPGELPRAKRRAWAKVKGRRWLCRCGQTLEWRPRSWEAGRQRCLHRRRPTRKPEDLKAEAELNR
jgi:hypothetical protein